jgi:RNA polymerase sigma factor for flagellar operon FliA
METKTNHAQNQFQQFAPLVATVVDQLIANLPATLSPNQLHNLGLVALLRAVRNYPPNSVTPFETFARIQIRAALLTEIRRWQRWSEVAVRPTQPATLVNV